MREAAGKCQVCGLSGFPEASLSITEAGATCQGCYFKWQQGQREQALEAERQAIAGSYRVFRWRMIGVAIFALLVVIATNWKSCGHLTSR